MPPNAICIVPTQRCLRRQHFTGNVGQVTPSQLAELCPQQNPTVGRQGRNVITERCSVFLVIRAEQIVGFVSQANSLILLFLVPPSLHTAVHLPLRLSTACGNSTLKIRHKIIWWQHTLPSSDRRCLACQSSPLRRLGLSNGWQLRRPRRLNVYSWTGLSDRHRGSMVSYPGSIWRRTAGTVPHR